MKVTIKDLAAEFGVDKATASRALRGKPGVSSELRDRIVAGAKTLGFFPNAQARSLATGKTETLALVFCDETSWFFENPFYSGVLAGIASESNARGFTLAFHSLASAKFRPGDSLPKEIRGHRADGFLFVGDQNDALITAVSEARYPVVLVDHSVPGADLPAVTVANTSGARSAVEYLISLGHRRIGFVSGWLKSPSYRERLAGYKAALQAHRCDRDPSLVRTHGKDAGYEGMRELLALPSPPTAVFAANDVLAVTAVAAIHHKGLRIPQDVSIMGFDDSRCATDTWPPLTTMRVDKRLMGQLAVRKLIGLIQRKDAGPRQTPLDVNLVIRDSTGPNLTRPNA
ncbi:MAG: LacI family DNA-binding transcriptional regulator [Verrucomicrobiota bacterium]